MHHAPLLALSLALLAAVGAGAARAVTLDPRGLGQALIYPYYTVNKGQDTLITVVNGSDFGSLVRVAASESLNGRDVMRFNVVLAPHDAWTARISQTHDGGAAIYSSDTSCVSPPMTANGFAFQQSAYAGGSLYPADAGPKNLARTREGFIKVIEWGTVASGSPLDWASRHGANGAAPACTASAIGDSAPTYLTHNFGGRGKLGGSAAIVNVGEGTFFAYAAEAIAAFSAYPVDPELRNTNSPESRFPNGAVAHVAYGNRQSSFDFAQGVDAASAVLMESSIANDYLVAAGLGAHTDWVITFPTKPFYTDFFAGSAARAPFVEQFRAPGVSNVLANMTQYDQEEGHGETAVLTLPWVVNVVSFGTGEGASGALGSKLALPVATFADAGTMTLDLAHGGDESHVLAAADGSVLHGLPATGFMVYNIINANAAPGKLANYGGAFPYRSTVSCTTSVDDSTPCE